VTVIRRRHAFEGQTLGVIHAIKRRGALLVLAILPNGSRSLIPAAWTDWRGGDASPSDDDIDHSSSVGKLGDLLALHKVIDEPAARRLEQLDEAARLAALAVLARLIARMLAEASAKENGHE
jgi:hypothetical protein